MERSLFAQYVEKWFKLIVGKVTERFNDKKEEEKYLHESMLTEEYSADLTWGSTNLDNSIVAADVVAMDSQLPLKSRPKLRNATGVLPKLGMKMRKGEKEISDINIMVARGTDESNVVNKIFNDIPRVIKGVKTRVEIMFQQALSTGETIVEQDAKNALGVRVSYGYKNSNIFHAIGAAWGQEDAEYDSTLNQMFDKANEEGNSIGLIMLSKKYFDYYRKSTEGRQLAARAQGIQVFSDSILGVANRNSFMDALEAEYGCKFMVIDSSFRVEKNDGTYESVKPWAEANIVAFPSENVGRLVYGTLAEETNPVNGVDYQKSGSYILVAKYSKTDPLQEFTTSQAICLPVIDNVDSIYMVHADSIASPSVDVDELEFTSAADSTGKQVNVHSDKSWSVASNQSWCTVTKSGKGFKVKVSANTAEGATERTATVTVTDADSNTATVSVTQAA